MDIKTIKVEGMNCNHCKMRVENFLGKMPGITKINVDLSSGNVVLSGENIDLALAEKTISELGYNYKGLVNS